MSGERSMPSTATPAGRERKPDPAGADGELERRPAPAGQPGEECHGVVLVTAKVSGSYCSAASPEEALYRVVVVHTPILVCPVATADHAHLRHTCVASTSESRSAIMTVGM